MSEDYTPMYTPETMERNLRIGDAGEAFFRYWFETHCSGLEDLVLHQFGYNPEGVIESEEKAEMLQELQESPDFAIYHRDDLMEDSEAADPILGISINTQREFYDAEQSQAAKMQYETPLSEVDVWGCGNCPQLVECFEGGVDNLWYNEYNISNDYQLFSEGFDVDVIMISIVSTIPYTMGNKFQDDRFLDEARGYLKEGQLALEQEDVVDFLDYLLFNQRYRNRTEPRDYQLMWLRHSEVTEMVSRDVYHITGGQTRYAMARPVACIDRSVAYDESSLVETLVEMSQHSTSSRDRTWYTNIPGEQSRIEGFD